MPLDTRCGPFMGMIFRVWDFIEKDEKRKDKHTPPRFLLVLFLLIFSVSCTKKSFICWNKEKTKAVAFSFDNILNTVTIADIHGYSTLTSSQKSLQSHMPGGTHRLKMDKDLIVLKVIQDTVFTKTKLPSGKFIKSHTEIETEDDYLKQKRYHAIYPVIHKYIFDKKLLKLSFSSRPLPRPRSAIEQKFIFDKATDDLYPEKTKDLSPEELSAIFPAHEKTHNSTYPDCKQENAYSIKRFFRTILRYFQFV